MKRIYLSPSSQEENRYAVGQTNEAEQCRKIALALAQELERMGFAVKTDVTPGKTMYDRVAQSNDWEADAHIPIHSNAFNGKVAGFRGFGYDTTGEGYQLAGAIMKRLAPVMPGTSDGLSAQPQLYEIRATHAPLHPGRSSADALSPGKPLKKRGPQGPHTNGKDYPVSLQFEKAAQEEGLETPDLKQFHKNEEKYLLFPITRGILDWQKMHEPIFTTKQAFFRLLYFRKGFTNVSQVCIPVYRG